MAENGPSAKATRAAAETYYFGVYPGDESEASEQEVEKMAKDVLAAAHDPALGLDRSACLADVSDLLTRMGLRVEAAKVVRAFTGPSSPEGET